MITDGGPGGGRGRGFRKPSCFRWGSAGSAAFVAATSRGLGPEVARCAELNGAAGVRVERRRQSAALAARRRKWSESPGIFFHAATERLCQPPGQQQILVSA